MNKKFLLLSLLFICAQLYSTVFLVKNTGSTAWTNAYSGSYTTITINPASSTNSLKSLNAWIAATTFNSSGQDTIFLAAGDYQVTGTITFKKGAHVYGGFAGAELYSSQRDKGANAWDYNNVTRILGVQSSLTDSVTAETNIRIGSFAASDVVTFFDGITFKNGAGNMKANQTGGALNVSQGMVIQNCIFENNATLGNIAKVANHGGAIHCYSDAATPTYNTNLVIKNTYFKNNQARRQGGALNIQANFPISVEGCRFEKNYTTTTNTTDAAPGGAIHFGSTRSSGTVTLKNSVFVGNYVSSANTSQGFANIGGAVAVNTGSNASGVSSTIENCKFINNMAASNSRGGALILKSNAAGSYTTKVSNCLFQNNSGANVLSVEIAGAMLTNLTFVNNRGALHSNLSGADNNLKLYNSVVWNNKNTAGTADVGITGGLWAEIKNTIGYFGSISPTTAGYLSNNTFVNNTSNSGSDPSGKYPYFENPSSTYGYDANANINTLEACSYKIGIINSILKNGGDNTLYNSISSSVKDLANFNRIFNSTIDVGAFEDNSNIVVNNGITEINIGGVFDAVVVEPAGKLTLNSGTAITINSIVLKSDESGTATLVDTDDNSTHNVTGTVQQYLSAERNWYISSPILNALSNSLNRGTSVQSYSEASKTWSVLGETDPLVSGKGYVSVAGAGLGSTGNISFSGLLNSGDISVPVTRTESGSSRGFNLVSNPYPSYLNWNLVVNNPTNSNIASTIWYRSKNASNNYVFSTYNGVGGVAIENGSLKSISNLIPPMQAFWIRVNSGVASTNLLLKNSMRSHVDVNTNLLKVSKNDDRPKLRLKLCDDSNSDEVLIYVDPNAANGFDRYDSPKFNSSGIVLFSKSDNELLAINGIKSVTNNLILPIGYKANSNTLLKLKIDELVNFDEYTKIFLIDKKNNKQIELEPNSEYEFTPADNFNTNEEQFNILFKTNTTTKSLDSLIDKSSVSVNQQNQIEIRSSEKLNYKIYNSIGVLVRNGEISASPYKITDLSSGLYVVNIVDLKGSYSVKVFAGK